MKKAISILVIYLCLSTTIYAQSLSGTSWKDYFAPIGDTITINFHEDSDTVTVNNSSGGNMVTGLYSLSNDTLSVHDLFGAFSCPSMTDTGVYMVGITANMLSLGLIEDSCTNRVAVLAGLNWTQCSPNLAGMCWEGLYDPAGDVFSISFGMDTVRVTNSLGVQMATSIYWVSGNALFIYDLTGAISCPTIDTGRYTMTIPGDGTISFSTINDPCLSRSAFFEGVSFSECSMVTGVNLIKRELKASVYPNPSQSGIFNIYLEDPIMETATFRVVNGVGAIVQEQELDAQHLEINLSNNSKGLYYLTIQTKNKIRTFKLIK